MLCALTEEKDYIPKETCEKLFRLPSKIINDINLNEECYLMNRENYKVQKNAIINEAIDRNNKILQDEINRIDDWANDKISGIQLKVELLREQRREMQKQADYSVNAIEKINFEKEINKISKTIKQLWLELADSEDIIEIKRKEIISKLKAESIKQVNDIVYFEVPFEVI